MSDTRRRSRMGRPKRRVKRWVRHTETREIALRLMAVGALLIFVAIVIALTL